MNGRDGQLDSSRPVKPQSVMTGTSTEAFYTDWRREEIRTRQLRNRKGLKCQA